MNRGDEAISVGLVRMGIATPDKSGLAMTTGRGSGWQVGSL